MDSQDIKICNLLQINARLSSTEIAQSVGLSVSATNERIRRLIANGTVQGCHATLSSAAFDTALVTFVLIDMAYDGEADAVQALTACDEVQELHHISGPHSYLMKLRLRDMAALHQFLAQKVKPLRAVLRTESIMALDSAKETSAIKITGNIDE